MPHSGVVSRLVWMRRGVPVVALLLIGACVHGRAEMATRPPASTADGATIRFRVQGVPWREGRAVGWSGPRARVVTADGDTVTVPCDAEAEALEAGAGNLAWQGALAGALAGGAIVAASCQGQKYCGEENPIPGLAMIAGYFVGRRLHVDAFRPVRVPGCEPAPPR
jgi:hypothetical protein